jgi:uncharacterized protein YyaL (SSP411 family)
MLGCVDMLVNGAVELAIVGDPKSVEFQAMRRTAAARYVPSLVVAGGPESGAGLEVALLSGRTTISGKPAAYLCRNRVCELPVTSPDALDGEFDRLAGAAPS